MKLLSSSVRHALGLVSGVLLVVALLLVVARVLLPHWEGLHAWVETRASEVLEREVAAGTIELGWTGWSPALVARDLRIAVPDGQPVELDVLAVSLRAWASLRAREPEWRLEVEGLTLRFIRHPDARITLAGRELGLREGALLALPVDRWPEVVARDVSVVWDDRPAGLEAAARLARARLAATPEGALRVHASGRLHPAAGGNFTFGLDIPDPAHRDARLFLAGDDLPFDYWDGWLDYLGWPVLEGTASLRAWGTIRDGEIVALRGSHDTALARPDAAASAPRAIGHRFDWRLSNGHYRTAWVGTRPGSGDMRLNYRLEADPRRIEVDALELGLRALDLEPYQPLLGLLEGRQPELAESLAQAAPHGRVEAARLSARRAGGALRVEHGEADLRDLGWHALGAWPGVAGLSGQLRWDGGRAELALDSRELRVELPELLPEPVWLTEARGHLQAERDTEGHWRLRGDDLHLANAHAAAAGRLGVRLDGHTDGPLVELALDFLRANGAHAARYLPIRYLPDNTRQWLVDAIHSAYSPGGGMVYRGRGRAFPFRGQEGIFELWADVEDGVLDYRAGWPRIDDVAGRLHFRNAAFRAEGASGRILDTRVENAEVRIADMRAQPVLEVEGNARGASGDLLDYLRQAGLLEGMADIRDRAEARGPAGLALALEMPLQGERLAESRVSGELDLRGVRLELPDWPVVPEAVEGRLSFDTAGRVQATGLRGRVHGEVVELDVDWPLDGGEASLAARGPQPLAPWLEHLPALQRHLSGTAHWEAGLRVGGARDGARLDLRSDLEGVVIDWPEPLGKAPGQPRALALSLPLGHASSSVGELRLGEVLRARLRLEPADVAVSGAAPTVAGLQALALELGESEDSPLALPGSGIAVQARFTALDLAPWAEALGDASWTGGLDVGTVDPAAPDGEREAALALNRLDLRVRHALRWGRTQLPGLALQARRHATGWNAEVRADWLAGEGRWEVGTGQAGAGRVDARLERLHLPGQFRDDVQGTGPSATDAAAVDPGGLNDPRAWPALDLELDSLRLGDYGFAGITLGLEPQAAGLSVRELKVRAPESDLLADALGAWTVDGQGRARSRLDVHLTGEDWGEGLRASGLSHALLGAAGEGQLSLSWAGALYAPRVPLLEGSMSLALEDGRLADVDPGAGRLLGLVSLDLLPRRLRLDFRDVFEEGLAFSALTTTATLADGDLVIPDLELEGASARVRLVGRTGLVAHDYDHRIEVLPRLRTALPLVGALVGGPVTGAVVFLAERVLGIGDQIEEAARVEYEVTGTWDEPQVRTRIEPVSVDND
ncbi:MAG: YhdP family protein [Pseudomonadota bacterium]